MSKVTTGTSMRLFVGGLDYNTVEADLVELFSVEGIRVVEVTVIKDRENQNRSKGFGFVVLDVTSGESMQEVIKEFNHARLGTRDITVNEATPKKPRAVGR